jgi:RNA polymerase sigma-70 factor, ECF subfamily
MTNASVATAAGEAVDDALAMDNEERFCCELTSAQTVLLSFVMSLVRDQHLARDIVQETNLVMWRKRGEFQPEREFRPWALRIAYLQTLAALKSSRRSRLVFDDEIALKLAVDAPAVFEHLDQRFLRLQECLGKLLGVQGEAVRRRYGLSQSIAEIARDLERSVSAVGMLLHRARLALSQCMQAGDAVQ